MYWTPLWNHYLKGNYDDALSTTCQASIPGFYHSKANFAMIYGQMGRTAESQLRQIIQHMRHDQ